MCGLGAGVSTDRTEADNRLEFDLELAQSIDVSSGLSDWEVEFVDSILVQLRSEKRPLSNKQRQVAERIQKKLDARAGQ
jgi:hypothetical protein